MMIQQQDQVTPEQRGKVVEESEITPRSLCLGSHSYENLNITVYKDIICLTFKKIYFY